MMEQFMLSVRPPIVRAWAARGGYAARFWATIQAWNDTPGRPHPEKIARSASILEKRFGRFRPTTKAFIEQHHHDIEAHNTAHGITAPAHNRGVPEHVWHHLKELAR